MMVYQDSKEQKTIRSSLCICVTKLLLQLPEYIFDVYIDNSLASIV